MTTLQTRPLYQAVQTALETLSRAEIACEAASLNNANEQQVNSARQECRAAVKQLRALETPLAELLQQSYQQRPSQRGKNDWTTQELESLQRNLTVQLARAYRNQALCYQDNSPDRLNALSLALHQLPDVVTQPLNETSVWLARVEQVKCLRLLKKYSEARQQSQRWSKASPPANIVAQLAAENLKLDLNTNSLDRALQKLDTIKATSAKVPELDDAILEALLVTSTQSTPQDKALLIRRAINQLVHISKTHGSFWQHRAEVRLGRALAEQPNLDDPELLRYVAASLYAAGKPAAAVAVYDRIASLQAIQEQAEQKFQALKTAAAIVRETGQPDQALIRFQQLALQHPQHKEAASMHVIAIGLAAEIARAAATDQRGKAFERYLALLQEHLQSWPAGTTAAKVQQWLARAELPEIERQRARTLAALGDEQQAIRLYQKLLKEQPDDPELLEACAQLLSTSDDVFQLREALTLWQQIERRSKPDGRRWWRARRARLALLEQLGEGKKAKQLRQLTEILYP